MSFTAGQSVETDDYLALFTALETLRAKHVAREGITSANKTKLQDKTLNKNTTHGVKEGASVVPANVTKVKNGLAFIEKYAVNLTADFASDITVPTVNTLLKASNLSTAKTKIAAAQKVCANCSFNSSVQSFNSSADGHDGSANGSWNSSWDGVVC